MMSTNVFNLPVSDTECLLHTSNGPLTTTKSMHLPVNNYFKNQHKFLLHQFSTNYDLLIGRNLLSQAQAVIDYKNKTVTLYNYKHKLINQTVEKEPKQSQETNFQCQEPILNTETNLTPSFYRLDHLNSEEKCRTKSLLQQYEHIQYKKGDKLTFSNQEKHTINTTHNSPIYAKYNYPQAYEQEVETQIEEILQQGIIRASNSPYNSPIWVVPKKQDASGEEKFRIVIDYRKLNEITVNDRYPIPNMDEILGKLGKCNYFTTIDLAKGFHQIEIDHDSIAKTAFSTKNGHYEYLRMPFGLKNAPATFQRCMNNILRPLLNKHCLVYLDDIIVFSTSLDEHLNSLRLVFDKLAEANLKLQPDKYEFLRQETTFLGHS